MNRIQIYVEKELMFKFEPLLQERQCYIIYNFGVMDNVKSQPLLPNHSKICFYKGRKVTRIDYIDDNDCAGMDFYKSYKEHLALFIFWFTFF